MTKSGFRRIAVDMLLIGLCFYGMADALKTSTSDWWLAFWIPLLAINFWALKHNISEMQEEREVLESLKAKHPLTDREQAYADAARLGVEPVETPDETWQERHNRECAICRKFTKGPE